MRWLSTLFIALLASISYGQITQPTIKLNELNPDGTPKYISKWVDVPAPRNPIVASNIGYSLNPWVWGEYVMTGGTFEVRNALVDKRHLVGAWSRPTTIVVADGWSLRSSVWNQPPTHNSIGVIWKVKCIKLNPQQKPISADFVEGGEYLYADNSFGVGPIQIKGPIPWAASTPNILNLQMTDNYYPLSRLRYGQNNAFIAPPPLCITPNVPLRDMPIQYCYVTHTGETALSPIATVKAPNQRPNTLGEFSCSLGEAIPMGALGYHLYVDNKRVQAPHCTGTPTTENDWLWQPNQYQLSVVRITDNGPAPSPAAAPKSYLNKLQVAMKETTGNVIVEDDTMELYSPIIDEYGMYPGTGGFFKFGRVISHSTGTDWYVTQAKSFTVDGQTITGYPTYWPGLVIHNQKSHWSGMQLTMKYGSCGLTYADYSGGQGFGNRFSTCGFGCLGLDDQTDQPKVPRLMTYGMRISNDCCLAGHTASEQLYENCSFGGTIAIGVENQQAANNRWDRVWAISYDAAGVPPDRRAFSFWLSAPVPMTFTNGVFAECPTNVIFGLGWSPQVVVNDLWVDGGCVSLVDYTHYQAGSIEFNKGKTNLWVSPGIRPNLARVYNTMGTAKMRISGTSLQFNNTYEADICSPATNRFDLWCDNTPFLTSVVLREPTSSQMILGYSTYTPASMPLSPTPKSTQAEIDTWTNWVNSVISPPLSGRGITIPATSVTIPAYSATFSTKNPDGTITNLTGIIQQQTVTIPAQTIRINSTDLPGLVKRKDWWAIP